MDADRCLGSGAKFSQTFVIGSVAGVTTAKNPGPSRWGAYVTRRKRKEKALRHANLQNDIKELMKSMMQQMMKTMIANFFEKGGGAVSGVTMAPAPNAKGGGKQTAGMQAKGDGLL